jgi:hypothetical protein
LCGLQCKQFGVRLADERFWGSADDQGPGRVDKPIATCTILHEYGIRGGFDDGSQQGFLLLEGLLGMLTFQFARDPTGDQEEKVFIRFSELAGIRRIIHETDRAEFLSADRKTGAKV